jgi:uncharacterized delta-60 repeat protein
MHSNIGTPELTPDWGFALACLNPDGTLDGTFGTGGLVVTAFPDVAAENSTMTMYSGGGINDLLVLPDGHFLAVGWSSLGELTVARYGPDGALDATYGTNGIAASDGPSTNYRTDGYSAAALPDGRLAVVDCYMLWVLDDRGQVVDQMGIFHSGEGDQRFAAAVLAPDGKLVAVGSAAPTVATVDTDFVAWSNTHDILVGRFTFDVDMTPLPKPPVPMPPPQGVPTDGPAVGGRTAGGTRLTAAQKQEARRARRAQRRAERQAMRERRRQERLERRQRRLELLLQRMANEQEPAVASAI